MKASQVLAEVGVDLTATKAVIVDSLLIPRNADCTAVAAFVADPPPVDADFTEPACTKPWHGATGFPEVPAGVTAKYGPLPDVPGVGYNSLLVIRMLNADGLTLADIRKRTCLSEEKVRRAMKALGLKPNRATAQPVNDVQYERAVALQRSGMYTLPEIATELGFHVSTVRAMLKDPDHPAAVRARRAKALAGTGVRP